MTIEDKIYDVLSASRLGADGVFRSRAPQRQPVPYAIFTMITGDDDIHLTGLSGLVRRVVQVDAFEKTPEAATDLINHLVSTMMSSATFQVSAVDYNGSPEFEEPVELYRGSRDFTVWGSI